MNHRLSSAGVAGDVPAGEGASGARRGPEGGVLGTELATMTPPFPVSLLSSPTANLTDLNPSRQKESQQKPIFVTDVKYSEGPLPQLGLKRQP